MKRTLLVFLVALLFANLALAQLVSDGRNFTSRRTAHRPGAFNGRSSTNPTKCGSDTSYFTSYGSTAYNSVTIRAGSSLGQYFGAAQTITVSGFRFYAYSIPPNPARPVYIRLRCNIYKAGADSLPTGLPLASDTITVDTVMGSSIPLSRIERNAVFKNPVTLNYGYIITVECDSTNVSAGMVTNSWSAGNGKKRNLGCGSVSGKWYRCLQLNIGGVTFDADMQMYPFVQYNFGTDFTINNDCYAFGDTVKFTNLHKNNVSSQPYYNYYIYYNLPQFSHRWRFDNSFSSTYMLDGYYKPATKKNFSVQLISIVYAYTAAQCMDTVEKIVYFKPDRPSLKKQARGCVGDTVSIDIAGDAGATLNWYHKLSDPLPFQAGNYLLIQNAQTNDTFYVQAVNGDCKSSFLRIDFTVSQYPNFPAVTNDSICLGAAANLSASSNLGKIEWFLATTGGVPFYLGNTYQTGKLLADTGFYVQANNNGCVNKGGRALVRAFVNNSFAPPKPQVVTDTFMCLRPSSSLHIVATQSGSDTLRWFSAPTGGKPIHRGDTFIFTPTTRNTETYYVETWNGICGSGRSPVNIKVSDYPTIYGLRGDTICPNNIAYPFLSVPWGTANWYLGKGNPNPVYIGETPEFAGLNANTRYYLETEEDGCASGIVDSVDILVNTPPVPSLVKADAVCAKAPGNMAVTVPYGKVNWYYQQADATPFHTGSAVSAGIILGSVTYYYETENQGCKSDKTPLTVVMKPRPTAGFTWTLQWQFRLICTPITTSGITMNWNWGDGNTSSGLPAVHQYNAKGNYTVRFVATSNANGCKDTADIPVIIDHTAVSNISRENAVVYPNPVGHGQILNIQGLKMTWFHAEILGMDGRVLAKYGQHSPELRIPDGLEAGIYILRLYENGRTQNVQLLVSE